MREGGHQKHEREWIDQRVVAERGRGEIDKQVEEDSQYWNQGCVVSKGTLGQAEGILDVCVCA